ncbi:hypothetical protein ILUMI_18140, partial [Ignelater luminosus]
MESSLESITEIHYKLFLQTEKSHRRSSGLDLCSRSTGWSFENLISDFGLGYELIGKQARVEFIELLGFQEAEVENDDDFRKMSKSFSCERGAKLLYSILPMRKFLVSRVALEKTKLGKYVLTTSIPSNSPHEKGKGEQPRTEFGLHRSKEGISDVQNRSGPSPNGLNPYIY